MQDRLKSDERVRVVGHRWSALSHEIKDFLTRNQVPFRWLELERDAGGGPAARGQRRRRGATCRWWSPIPARPCRLPRRPRWPALSGCRRRRRSPSMTSSSSGVVPPGWAPPSTGRRKACARCWSSRRRSAARPARAPGSRTIWASRPGSAAATWPEGRRPRPAGSGRRCCWRSEVTGLEVCGSARVVRLADGSQLSAQAVLLTTGCRLPPTGRPGYRRLHRERASTTGRRRPRPSPCRGEDVYIVGGANSAGQAAVFFARDGPHRHHHGARSRAWSVRCPTT